MADKTLDAAQERLRILDDGEIEALYGYPHFTFEEQLEYFTLSLEEKAVMGTLHSTKSCVFFVLQLGYFRVRRLFFKLDMGEIASFRVCWHSGNRPGIMMASPCWQGYPRWLGHTSTYLGVMSLASQWSRLTWIGSLGSWPGCLFPMIQVAMFWNSPICRFGQKHPISLTVLRISVAEADRAMVRVF